MYDFGEHRKTEKESTERKKIRKIGGGNSQRII